MMNQSEYAVRYADELPIGCHGVTVVDNDGFANIYLNPKYDQGHQEAAFRHELRHFMHDDAYNADPIQAVEARASGLEAAPDAAPAAPSYAEQFEEIFRRGKELYGIDRDAWIWNYLFDLWFNRDSRIRYSTISTQVFRQYSKARLGTMLNRIFREYFESIGRKP